MNGKLIVVAAICAALPLVEARGNAIADQIRSRAVLEWLDAQNAQQDEGAVAAHDDTPQRATGWVPSDSSGDAPLVDKKRIGSDEDERTDVPSATPPAQDEPVTVVQPVVSEPVALQPVVQPVSSTPTVNLDFMGVSFDLDLSSSLLQVVQAMEQRNEERSSEFGMTVSPIIQAHDQRTSAQQADELARYAGKSELEQQLTMNVVLFNARRHSNSISIESVSRESVGATSGSLIDEKGDVVGAVQLTTSNVKQGSDGGAICDLTVQRTDLNGKRTVTKVKGIAVSEVTLETLGLDAALAPGTVGGNLEAGEALCCIDFSSGFGNLDVVAELLPLVVPIQCDAKGKWKLDKAAKVKLAKKKDGTYSLTVDNQNGKTNVSGLKLTYKPKTGVFTGSFKLYAIGGTSARPKLVTKQVKVSGLVVDGIGSGMAKVAGTDLAWPVCILGRL